MKLSIFSNKWLKILCQLGVSGVLALSAINSNAVTYYKSTGSHGEVKFSQFPPNGKFELIELRSDGRRVDTGKTANTTNPNAQGDTDTANAQDQEKQAMQKRIEELEKQENARNCKNLRDNLTNLNSGSRIYEKNEDGSKQFLDDNAIKQKRNKIQQALNQYCSGQSA